MRGSSPAQLREEGAGQQGGRLPWQHRRAAIELQLAHRSLAQRRQHLVERRLHLVSLIKLLVQLTQVELQRGRQLQSQPPPPTAHAFDGAPAGKAGLLCAGQPRGAAPQQAEGQLQQNWQPCEGKVRGRTWR